VDAAPPAAPPYGTAPYGAAPYAPPAADTGYPPPRHGGGGTASNRSRTSTPRHGSGEWRTVADRRPPDQPAPRRTRREDASPWHWLLLVPIVVPLMPGLYNRIEPTLLGVPFFYWGQLGFAFLASAVIAFVHMKVR
jgi:hypothetical protein